MSFTAVVAVQVLTAYRTQLERHIDKEEVESRRKAALVSIRMTVSMLIFSVLIGVVLMAQLAPERAFPLPGSQGFFLGLLGIFFLVYALLGGVVGLFLTVEEL